VLVGDQGTYKSTFFEKLGQSWFSDSFNTVVGKESFEQLHGVWIMEMAELSGMRKAEVEAVKHYVTKTEDRYRPAFGKVVETYKRQVVFFGTTNIHDFLRDPTGNRRFVPVDVERHRVTKHVPDMQQEEINQIWAEAVHLFKKKERLYMSVEAEELARGKQTQHSSVDERQGIIERYLETKLPKSWDETDLSLRRMFLEDNSEKGTEVRDYFCTAEVWCECLGKEKKDMDRYKTRDLNDTLKKLEGWEYVNSTKNFPLYGKQKYYRKLLL
jgi:predicted P-loop ATPase